MQSPSSKSEAVEFPIAPAILLSLATGPVLLGIVTSKVVAKALQALGQTSEEVFRGDRLPILDLFDKETKENS